MHLAFDICTGVGVAAAFGVRPFLAALAVGALAAGHVELHFDHTDYAFLQSWPFLLAMALAAIALVAVERRLTSGRDDRRALVVVLGIVAGVLGALMFAGSLARGHYAAWPGWIGGVVCAGVAVAATRPLFARVRNRLDPDAAAALPVYAEVIAVAMAALSVVAPPLGAVALLLLIWLIAAGGRREGQKYAGLRILR